MAHILSVLALLCALGTLNAQRDPVTNFCRRFGHQTAVIDRKLYIDGGFMNWNSLSSDPTNYTNTWLLYQDLDEPGSAGMPQLYANLSKNASLPSVHGGILWADDVNKKFYLFGGEYYIDPPVEFVLYAYDVLYDNWQSLGSPPDYVNSVSYGAGVSVSSIGQAYYYGGWLSNNSVPGWDGPRMATDSLIQYGLDDLSWTGAFGPDSTRRAEGAMVYIPAGGGGMLVYFGGVQDTGNGSVVGQPMQDIFLYDILTSQWYQQTATGDVPEMRSRFCAGATWADDQSSYNIYLYGGAGMPPSIAGFDDVYILSLPSFTWIKYYPKSNGSNQYPHNTLTCNVIDGAQMMIIGGSFPLDDLSCDAPEQYGSHNLDLGRQNEQNAQWNLYQPMVTSYDVPSDIISVIGGGPKGGAAKTVPDDGFTDPDLEVYLGQKFIATARTPTRPTASATDNANANKGELPRDTIAGIVVGCTAAFVVTLACCAWLVRRRRRQKWYPSRSTGAPLIRHSSWRCGSAACGGSGNGAHDTSTWSPHSPHHTPTSLYAASASCVPASHLHCHAHAHQLRRSCSLPYPSAVPSLHVRVPGRHQQQLGEPVELEGSIRTGRNAGATMEISPLSATTAVTTSPLQTLPSHVSSEEGQRQRQPPSKYEYPNSGIWNSINSNSRSNGMATYDSCQGSNQRVRSAMTAMRKASFSPSPNRGQERAREQNLHAVRNWYGYGLGFGQGGRCENERVTRSERRRRFSFESPIESSLENQWDGDRTENEGRNRLRNEIGNRYSEGATRTQYATGGFGPSELSTEIATPGLENRFQHETFYHP
ncbi:hypothetical protein F5Y19DRAFT_116791 [Xylariaceae sp. FL1651]|nr:hypothetical protein F5Y19DRAFT_116791 [Xylariaceae sp. FL1651]